MQRILTSENWSPVLSRDVFEDSTGKIAEAAFRLGFVHRKLKVKAPNETPLGTVIAAPPAEERELFCRNGLKWFQKFRRKNIRAALKEIEKQRAVLRTSGAPSTASAEWHNHQRAGPVPGAPRANWIWRRAWRRNRANSCLWQAGGGALRKTAAEAKRLAQAGIRELQKLEKDFNALLAVAQQGHAETLLGFPSLADQ